MDNKSQSLTSLASDGAIQETEQGEGWRIAGALEEGELFGS